MIQVAIAAVNILIFALAFTSIWPFPSGDFKLNLPESEDVEWSIDDGFVYVSAPYSIDNGGFYDVSDLQISYEVTNYTSALVHSDTITIGTIPAGAVTSDTIEFSFPLSDFHDASVVWLIFNDDFLNFALEVSCYYTMKLVHFYAEYSVSVPWDALIQDIGVDEIWTDGAQLQVNYHATTSGILHSLGTTTIIATLYNGSSFLAQDSDSLVLGTTHSGTFSFDLPFSSIPGRIVLETTIVGYHFVETIPFDSGWLT